MIRWLVVAIGLSVVATPAFAAEPIEIGIGYLGHAGVKANCPWSNNRPRTMA